MSENSYSPPQHPTSDAVESKDLQALVPGSVDTMTKIGLLIFGGAPILGFVVKIFIMVRAYKNLTQKGAQGAADLSDAISYAMWSQLFGGCVGLIGAVMLCVAFRRGVNVPWIRTATIVLSCLWAFLVFPFGIFVGLIVGVVAHRS